MRRSLTAWVHGGALVAALLAAPGTAAAQVGTASGTDTGSATAKPGAEPPAVGVRYGLLPSLDILFCRGIGTAITDDGGGSGTTAHARGYERLWASGTGFGLMVLAPFEQIEADGTVKSQTGAAALSITRFTLPGRTSHFGATEAKPDDLVLTTVLVGFGGHFLTPGEGRVRGVLGLTACFGMVRYDAVDIAAAGSPSNAMYESLTTLGIEFRGRAGVQVQVTDTIDIHGTLVLGYLFAGAPNTAAPHLFVDSDAETIFNLYWGLAVGVHIRF